MQAARLHLPRRRRSTAGSARPTTTATTASCSRTTSRTSGGASMLQERDDIVAIDSAIIQHPRVWEASGHLAGFTDPMVDCKTCKLRFRADHLEDGAVRPEAVEAAGRGARLRAHRGARVQPDVRDARRPGRGLGARSPTCGPRPRRASSSTSRTCCSSRARSRRSGSRRSASRSATRSRPATSSSAPASSSRWRWSSSARPTRRREVARALDGRADALVHRARHPARQPDACAPTTPTSSRTTRAAPPTSSTCFPMGFSELEGIANRGDFDLTAHAESRGEKLEYFDQQTKERYVPHVIEPAAGVDRAMLAFLVDAYDVEEVEGRERTVLHLHPKLAPVKVAVLPLVSQGRDARARARDLRLAAPPDPRRVRRGRLDRQALPPPGRDRHAVGRHRRRPDGRGRHRHPARPRLARADAGPGRGPRGPAR